MNLPSDHLSPPAPPPTRLLRRGRPLGRLLVRRHYRIRVHRSEQVPLEGPVVLAANHLSLLDGPLLALLTPRPVHTLTKIEMFDGLVGALLRAAGQIPVDRSCHDAVAVKTSLRVLDAGGALGIFPEGVRGDGELREVRPGAAYFAMVTGAPVVPVTFFGTRDPGADRDSVPGRGAAIDVVYGSPFPVHRTPWPRTRRQVERTRAELHEFLRSELESAKSLTGRSLPGLPSWWPAEGRRSAPQRDVDEIGERRGRAAVMQRERSGDGGRGAGR